MKNSIKILVLILLSTVFSFAEPAKVVYDLTSGDVLTIKHKLLGSVRGVANHYIKNKEKVDIIVVISGDAYKFFIDDLESSPYAKDEEVEDIQMHFKPRLEMLHELYGVTFNMCKSGMIARKIDKKTLYPYVNVEMMKSVYLINAQNDGYAYLPIH
ncbi:DsrE family protein [Sulfurovum sp.]|uniref:DsrE family protein n=1 Tax=Sulfurovum sp. TaxID=1969726 RepID=UPI002867DCE0|nr:DsrE family protein [Sulfurovum sp.]